MTTDWIELKTGKEAFDRAAEGWEIEILVLRHGWEKWGGRFWYADGQFRGRPPQPKTKVVISECWRHKESGALVWRLPGYVLDSPSWQRFPAHDKTGEVSDE